MKCCFVVVMVRSSSGEISIIIVIIASAVPRAKAPLSLALFALRALPAIAARRAPGRLPVPGPRQAAVPLRPEPLHLGIAQRVLAVWTFHAATLAWF